MGGVVKAFCALGCATYFITSGIMYHENGDVLMTVVSVCWLFSAPFAIYKWLDD